MKLSEAFVERTWAPRMAIAALLGTSREWVAEVAAKRPGIPLEWRPYDGEMMLTQPLSAFYAELHTYGYDGPMEFLTAKGIAAFLGVGQTTVYDALKQRPIRPLRLSIYYAGRWVQIYRLLEVEEYLADLAQPENHGARYMATVLGRGTTWTQRRYDQIVAKQPSATYEDILAQLALMSEQEQLVPPAGTWLSAHQIARRVTIQTGRSRNWTMGQLRHSEFQALKEDRRADNNQVLAHWDPEIVAAVCALAGGIGEDQIHQRAS